MRLRQISVTISYIVHSGLYIDFIDLQFRVELHNKKHKEK